MSLQVTGTMPRGSLCDEECQLPSNMGSTVKEVALDVYRSVLETIYSGTTLKNNCAEEQVDQYCMS
jgi:hypothetical protein